MKVKNFTFDDSVISSVRAYLIDREQFTIATVRRELYRRVPVCAGMFETADRAADRLLQRMKKAGEIEFRRGAWRNSKLNFSKKLP